MVSRLESDVTDKYGEQQGKIYLKKIKELIDKGEHNLDIDQNKIRAKEARFSIKCTVKMFLRDYIFALITGVTIVAYVYYKIAQCCRRRRINKLARGLYQDIKKNLTENQNGLSESDILRKYLALPM